MTPDAVKRYAAPVPRYTSYPTAPFFTPTVTADDTRRWLAAIAPESSLSLYVHIPFCPELCWYCGCNTKAVQRYEPVANYLEVLEAEIRAVAGLVPAGPVVSHIHLGGGSPCILEPADLERLAERLRARFVFAADAELAIEIDPRRLTPDRARALGRAGFNRASIGVQDFDPRVQAAINRHQSPETTRRAAALLREAGVRSLNVDLVYGLPYQTREGIERTVAEVLALAPDRIALFGYAHIPSRISHQRLIADASLPEPVERYAQMSRAADMFVAAGMVRIGLDHFAKPADTLASGEVRRNFQGYTTDRASSLIGLGASAIGQLAEGFVQNATPLAEYERRVRAHGLATVRGFALSADDRMRGLVIERLMCDLAFPARELADRYGAAAGPVLDEARALLAADVDGLLAPGPAGEGFLVTEKGRPFLRSIAAAFDAYHGTSPTAKHAVGV